MNPRISLPRILPAPLLLLALASSPAQTPAAAAPPSNQPTTIAVDARLVNLPVVVRDKKGALVTTLTRDDFALTVDGHPEAIRYFNRDTDLPLTLGLLVDTSGSVRDALDAERTASAAFLDTMLTTPKDRAFVIQFARNAELLQDLTSSKPKLQAALKQIDTEAPSFGNNSGSSSDPNDQGGPGSSGSGRHRGGGGGTTLYDATFLAAEELMSKQTGRKALVLLTDGDDRGSKETLAHAIEAAQRSNSILYAIYFKGEQHNSGNGGGFPGNSGRHGGGIGFPGGGYPGGGGGGYPGGGRNGGGYPGGNRGGAPHEDGKKVLERMCGETGGRVFEVSKKQTVEDIYKQIADELRSEYRLGFTPTDEVASDGYHQVDLVTPKDKSLHLQTRDGYYTGQ